MLRLNLRSQDAYGIDPVRYPLWNVYWYAERHEQIAEKFKRLGFKTEDTIGIDTDPEDKPIVYRL